MTSKNQPRISILGLVFTLVVLSGVGFAATDSSPSSAKENHAVAPAIPAVRFQVIINGKPATESDLLWHVGGRFGGKIKTDDHGCFVVDQRTILQAQSGGLNFCVNRPLESPHGKPPSPLFTCFLEGRIPVPQKFGETIPIVIQTTHFGLQLTFPPNYEPDPKNGLCVSLKYFPKNDPNKEVDWVDFGWLPTAAQMEFSDLLCGQWQLIIFAHGTTVWQSDIFTVSPGMSPMQVTLEPGSSVRMEVGDNDSTEMQLAHLILNRDGKPFLRPEESTFWDIDDLHAASFGFGRNYLPIGKYHLHLPSLAEILKIDPDAASKENIPLPPPVPAFDLNFEVTPHSPKKIILPAYHLKDEKERQSTPRRID
ncbi:MAG: hypothetical protein QM796_03640 [Chthoniobacteraceae bacterium]